MHLKIVIDGKALKHKADLFTHIKELLYKHVMDKDQKFMALIIPKAWKYTVLVEAHGKLSYHAHTVSSNENIIGRE